MPPPIATRSLDLSATQRAGFRSLILF
jgi:hypothetical protein